jgi:probable phosphoglycerate mutase
MRLLLVRHALHDWVGRGIAGRQPQVTLNGEGELQARDLAQRLAGTRIDAIYSSPQPRARATAEPLAQARGMRIEVLHEFDEIAFGEWEGMSFAELDANHHDAWQHWVHRRASARLPGGENIAQVRDRAMQGVRRVRDECRDGTALVVSHGDVIKTIVATQLEMSLDNLEKFDVACASVTVLDVGEDWSQLKQVSGTAA